MLGLLTEADVTNLETRRHNHKGHRTAAIAMTAAIGWKDLGVDCLCSTTSHLHVIMYSVTMALCLTTSEHCPIVFLVLCRSSRPEGHVRDYRYYRFVTEAMIFQVASSVDVFID